jgi:hypothetical protein
MRWAQGGRGARQRTLVSTEANVRREPCRDRRRAVERGMPAGSRSMVDLVYDR